MSDEIDFVALDRHLVEIKAGWRAREISPAELSMRKKSVQFGLAIDQADLVRIMAPELLTRRIRRLFAAGVDWRNHNGNHVTPVKDQGNCGSCVSFGCVALVESIASIETNQLLDLSEADLHFCSSHGASCGGWWPTTALSEVKNRGVVGESVFSYQSAFASPPQSDPNPPHYWIPHCHTTQGRDAEAVKIGTYGTLSTITERKNYLSKTGPCVAAFDVYTDFFWYSTGVYHHVWGGREGGHAIEVIGYSDADGCWICKNSWGTGFGEQGFFRIAYGECGIDNVNPFWTAKNIILPQVETGPYAVTGVITFFRAHDKGSGYGPNYDFIDGEVVIKLNTDPGKSFGFQMRNDTYLPSRKAMFNILKGAYENGKQVTVEYLLKRYHNNGRIIRVVVAS